MAQQEQKISNTALLSHIYKEQPLEFRQRCSFKLAKYNQDIITNWRNEITELQFINYLNGKISSSLAKIMFKMIYSSEMDSQNNDKIELKRIHVTKADVIKFVSNDGNEVGKVEKPKPKPKSETIEPLQKKYNQMFAVFMEWITMKKV
eukprot:484670_1